MKVEEKKESQLKSLKTLSKSAKNNAIAADNIVFKISPKNRYKIDVEIKEIRKGKPRINLSDYEIFLID